MNNNSENISREKLYELVINNAELAIKNEKLNKEVQFYKKKIKNIYKSKRYKLGKGLVLLIKKPRSLIKYSNKVIKTKYKKLINRFLYNKNKIEDLYTKEISVIIPTYRKNKFIAESIDSVLNQTLPQNQIKIIIVVNGKDKEYFNFLKNTYKSYKNINVYYTSNKGVSSARNLGIDKTKTEYVTFLDDDDYFTKGFLEDLLKKLSKDTSIVCGRFIDLKDGEYNFDNYVNRALKNAENKDVFNDVLQIGSLFATVCGKLYKTSLLQKSFAKFDNNFTNTEDVIFWADNFEKIKGTISCLDNNGTEGYVRRVLQGSKSRPNSKELFKFIVNDRIKIINRISKRLFEEDLTIEQKYFLLNLITSQHKFLETGFIKFSRKEKQRAIKIIEKEKNFFINKGKFSNVKGVAFCYNFSPAADPSAYVATKRLNQINNIVKKNIGWDVISSNLSNMRSLDLEFKNFYTNFVINKLLEFPGPSYFDEKEQSLYAEKASDLISPISYDFIYSRSMAAGSHIAAYKYKLKHPNSKWYAEFSDPLFLDNHNQKRPVLKKHTGEESCLNDFWRYVERTVYEYADVIIFTNENQREFMLTYNDDENTKKQVLKKSLVLFHPILDKTFTKIHNSKYPLNKENINIGYFGSFYPNRDVSDMLKLINNPRVKLHLFVSKPRDLEDLNSKPQINISGYVSHLEFLNIASRMDYLFLNDMDFPGDINPYLPSKLADYIASGTKIIAKINKESPLSKFEYQDIIKIEKLTKEFIQNL